MNYKATLCDITMHPPYDSRECKFTDRDPRTNTEVMGGGVVKIQHICKSILGKCSKDFLLRNTILRLIILI